MSPSIITLGMDVHKESITLAVLPGDAAVPTRVDRLPNDLAKLRRYCDRLAEQGELGACYEASGAGYVLHRAMREWGYACDVIAPSLIPIKPGVQRKHDKYDAAQLTRLHRAGELTAVRVPSEAEERVRDVVRCRETFRRESLKSRHYILKFLARRGCAYRDGENWTHKHLAWLRALAAIDSPLAREDALMFREYLALLEYKLLQPAALPLQGDRRHSARCSPQTAVADILPPLRQHERMDLKRMRHRAHLKSRQLAELHRRNFELRAVLLNLARSGSRH